MWSRLLLTIFALAVTGCTYSVHPLLTQEEFANDIDISGHWQLEMSGRNEKEQQRIPLELEKYDTSTYDVYLDAKYMKQNATKGQEYPDAWTLQLGRVQGQLYGQMIPRDEPTEPPFFGGIPVYVFFRVEVDNEQVKVFPMLDNRSAQIADNEKLRHIKYPVSEFVELTVFTGNSAELQEMIVKHGKQLFKSKPVVLRRSHQLDEKEKQVGQDDRDPDSKQ